MHRFGVEDFVLKEMNQQQFLVVISNSYTALENSDAGVNISSA